MKVKLALSDAQRKARHDARNERYHAAQRWHTVYVIWPRRFDDGTYHFFEYVERCKGVIVRYGRPNKWGWKYRELV